MDWGRAFPPYTIIPTLLRGSRLGWGKKSQLFTKEPRQILEVRPCRAWGFLKGPEKEPQELLRRPQPKAPNPMNPSSAKWTTLHHNIYRKVCC